MIERIVYRLTLHKNKVHAEYFGQADEDIFDFEETKREKRNLEGPRSGVLPSFGLVEVAGIEPASSRDEPGLLRVQLTRRFTRLLHSRQHVANEPSGSKVPSYP